MRRSGGTSRWLAPAALAFLAGVVATLLVVDLLVGRKIKAVFVESSVPAKHVRSLVEACAARDHEVAIGRELYSDAMGPAETPEGTYVGMVEYNVKAIVEALK